MKWVLNSLTFILLIMFSNSSSAQGCFDEIADIEIPTEPHNLDKESAERIEFLRNTNCFIGEELDTIDLEILTEDGYMQVMLMFEVMENDDPITYRRLKELMVNFITGEDYTKVRELHLLTRNFTKLPGIYDNWEKDKKLLLDLGIPEDRLEPFKNYLEKHPNTGKTYGELMIDFEKSKAKLAEEE